MTFLQENADKAKAWANTVGVGVSEIGSYVSSLTSVLLRADTRVTNHGFDNGKATAVQSVLEAGTAVLVDHFGVPRVKCYCGNPLVEPEPVKSDPTYSGPGWQGFEPNTVQVVTPAPVEITVIVVVDVDTGQPFGRPIGTDGSSDANATLPPRDTTPVSTTTTRPQTTTTTTKPTTTTAPPAGNSDLAIKLVRDALQRCIDAVYARRASALLPARPASWATTRLSRRWGVRRVGQRGGQLRARELARRHENRRLRPPRSNRERSRLPVSGARLARADGVSR